MTIRLRLTLVYSAILALTLVIFGVTLYTIQSQGTLTKLEQDLVESSNINNEPRMRRFLLNATNEFLSQSPPTPRTFSEFSGEGALSDIQEREIVRLLDPFGNLVASPFGRDEDALPLSEEALEALQGQEAIFETDVVKGEEMLIYSRPVIENGELVYIFQAARSLKERNRTLRSLSTILLTSGSITTLAAFIVGWILSGLTLRPIDRITQTAQAIGEESDFSRRVKHTGKDDEVGKLANTFNHMLTRLQNAYQRVEHSLQQQRDFVSDVSHELRTPLTTLRGNMGLLLHKPPVPEDEQEDILSDMVEESDRMIRLVNDLLLLAHADADRSLAREELLIEKPLKEVVRQANLLDTNRQIHLEITNDLNIFGDRDAFKQVIMILLDNALKYSEVDVNVRAYSADDMVKIQVEDKGQGISAEELAHVFDRFYRSEEQNDTPGFGLGLAIAKLLVEGMGGEISIESQKGAGSTITLSFARL